MARTPAPRDNYRQEALIMNRIAGTIQVDQISSSEWKERAIDYATRLMRMFLEHDAPDCSSRPIARKDGHA